MESLLAGRKKVARHIGDDAMIIVILSVTTLSLPGDAG
jgi:hypothetical protein